MKVNNLKKGRAQISLHNIFYKSSNNKNKKIYIKISHAICDSCHAHIHTHPLTHVTNTLNKTNKNGSA